MATITERTSIRPMNTKFRKVLVVDDCPIVTQRVSKTLRAEGYFVSTANSGAEALSQIEQKCPDYVITDWEMPNINGEMLCQILRTRKLNNYLYLIIMTAHSEMLSLVDGLGAGADDYITKPIVQTELLARMKSGARILELDRRLSFEAQHDPLTGILNRRALMPSIKSLARFCTRRETSLSCIMLDVDHFKSINDTHGHQAGDEVLVHVADRLASRFRSTDLVCRYGGEEFIIVLPDCDEAGAAACADRCRVEIEQLEFVSGNEKFSVTASFGCAELRTNEAAVELIDRADRALLAAKAKGKNVVVASSTIESPSECELV